MTKNVSRETPDGFIDEYFTRINLKTNQEELKNRVAEGEGMEVLAELLLAHEVAIPFESIDPLLFAVDRVSDPADFDPVKIDPRSVFEKLVRNKRGGFCHEHALLTRMVLEELGFHTRPVLARVLIHGKPGVGPLSHQASIVSVDGREVLVDNGFGAGTPPVPLPLDRLGEIRRTDHGEFRLMAAADVLDESRLADHEIVLQRRSRGEFDSMYGFSLREVFDVDLQMSNWWAATRPGGPFTSQLAVVHALPEGGRVSLTNTTLARQGGGEREETQLASAEDLGRILQDEFGIELNTERLAALWEKAVDFASAAK